MTNEEKIMEKIRALLEKTEANGATAEEAAAAATAAQRLMAKYKIEAVNAPKQEEIDSTEFESSRAWHQILADTLAKNLCCKCIVSGKTVIVMGKESDRKIWQQLFEKFFLMIYKGTKAAKAAAMNVRGNCRDIEYSYASGFIRAIGDAMGEQCRALQLVADETVEETFNRRFPRIHIKKSRSRINGESYRNGYNDGKSAAGQKRLAG